MFLFHSKESKVRTGNIVMMFLILLTLISPSLGKECSLGGEARHEIIIFHGN